MNFERSVELPASIETCFQFHERLGALNRLIPPWESVAIERSDNSLEPGSEVLLATRLMGISLKWLARHESLDRPFSFVDYQVQGPFAAWRHEHLFATTGPGLTQMTDRVSYKLPLGRLGSTFGGSFIAKKLDAMFDYRHRLTRQDLAFASALSSVAEGDVVRKKIAVTGSRGLIGSHIVSLLTTLGHKVIRLDRSSAKGSHGDMSPYERNETRSESVYSVNWDPEHGLASPESLDGIDAVIHLAGKGIGDHRWTQRVKSDLRTSRVQATSILVKQLAKLPHPPSSFVCASGVGIYGDQGDQVLGETQPPASDFLGNLAADWEKACSPLAECGARVCFGRLGVVLTPRGGALAKMLPLFRFGLAGILGTGKQYWSWIGHEDASSAFVWLALNPSCHGPYNLVAGSVTNAQFTQDLARVLHRPALLPVPRVALRVIMGEMADGLLLNSTRAMGSRLLATGYPMRQIDLVQTFQELLGVQRTSKSAIFDT